MKKRIIPAIGTSGFAVLLLAAAMSDGGASLRDAALMGLAGIVMLAFSIYQQAQVDAARRDREALHRSRSVREQREKRQRAS